jgi:hypothetical protein
MKFSEAHPAFLNNRAPLVKEFDRSRFRRNAAISKILRSKPGGYGFHRGFNKNAPKP